ncbi:dynein heavy chain axonemal [Lasius niger]|uniref:Dynein heavy chain axonemal n=1 Tax=Lasius niger TaxID=67767 RepID=A0A0J7L869_LASNI|nr:dynein heavy chain axonemal [Lasius niger]
MAAMGPPGGGRNVITDRLLTKFNVINMTFPTEKQIIRIYGTMLNQQLSEFHAEVKGISNDITLASIKLYNHVIRKMLPTPTKMHYLFNLRDISKVFQGLLRSHKDYQYSRQTFLRLWVHESFRVFCDRLIDEKDREWFVTQLNDQLGKHFELTFYNVCPEKRCPIFGSFMNAWNIYEDLPDIGAVRRYMEEQMDEYNASRSVVRLDLILFRDAIEHPHGNILLVGIGGSGRQSLSRIGSYMCDLSTYQVAITAQYRIPEFREDLKTLYSMTGVENKPTSFLFNDTQVVEEQFLEIVNNMLSTGEVANLYKSDEMEDIKNRLSKEVTKAGKTPTTETVYCFLIERARANMHLILCMSPIGDAFRNRLRQYPSLINCTTIDWFLEWPREALLEVGNKFLMNLNLTLTITGENKVALEALSKKDLAEIKSFTHPPPKVEMVMEAVMILKNSEPTWGEAKRQLSDVNFINTLRDFDKDHISDRVLRTIAKYTSNPEFDPIKVGAVSVAAKSLCMWVIAMEKYGKLYRIVAPKRERLQIALESLKQKEMALEETMQQLQNLHEQLERLQRMYDAKMKEKEDLIKLASIPMFLAL